MNGIINVLKPAGMTSHDVVGQIRRIYGIRRVGHAGTLDPLAAGVLPVFTGKATRLLEFAQIDPKIYVAEWIVGISTDTEDTSGDVIVGNKVPDSLTEKNWQGIATQFTGIIKQTPSRYSAIKIKGRKSYELARQKIEFLPPERTVQVYGIEIINWQPPFLQARIICSTGTYVRSLGRDMAHALGTEMTLSFLLRESVGPNWHVNESFTLEEIENDPANVVQNPATCIAYLPRILLNNEQAKLFRHGQRIARQENIKSAFYSVWNGNLFAGIAKYDSVTEEFVPYKVWVEE